MSKPSESAPIGARAEIDVEGPGPLPAPVALPGLADLLAEYCAIERQARAEAAKSYRLHQQFRAAEARADRLYDAVRAVSARLEALAVSRGLVPLEGGTTLALAGGDHVVLVKRESTGKPGFNLEVVPLVGLAEERGDS
jgi:hypothetical protein